MRCVIRLEGLCALWCKRVDGGGIKAHDLWKLLTKGRLRACTRETIKGIYKEIWIATLYRAREKGRGRIKKALVNVMWKDRDTFGLIVGMIFDIRWKMMMKAMWWYFSYDNCRRIIHTSVETITIISWKNVCIL